MTSRLLRLAWHVTLIYFISANGFSCSAATGTATAELSTLSLHDALPIYQRRAEDRAAEVARVRERRGHQASATLSHPREDRKSTRLNSSHRCNSYDVRCLKKKNDVADVHARCVRHNEEIDYGGAHARFRR